MILRSLFAGVIAIAILPSIAFANADEGLIIVNTEAFEIIDDTDTSANPEIRFGGTLNEKIYFDRAEGHFSISNDLYTSYDLAVGQTISGSALRVMQDAGVGTEPNAARFHIKGGGMGEKFRYEIMRSPYSLRIGGGMTGTGDEVAIVAGAGVESRDADTSASAWALNFSGIEDYVSLSHGINNGAGNDVTWTPQLRIDSSGNVGIGLGSASAESRLEVAGTASGSALHASDSLTSSGELVVAGSMIFGDALSDVMTIGAGTLQFLNDISFSLNGGVDALNIDGSTLSVDALNDRVGIGTASPDTTLDVAGAVSGSSLTISGLQGCDTIDTDAQGQLVCGTDDASAGGGLDTASADTRYVRIAGGTMTGALEIDIANTDAGTGLTLRERAFLGQGATVSGTLMLRASENPAAPEAASLNVYAKMIANRMMLKGMGPSGVDYPYQPSFFQNQIVMLNAGASTTVNSLGTSVTNDTTVSHPAVTEAYGYMTNFATSTTANDTAGTSSTNVMFFRGSQAGANGFFFNARVGMVDNASVRLFTGLSNQTIATTVGNDNPTGHHVGFQYSTNRGDTAWQFESRDGTNQNVTNTGITASTGKVYDMYFYCKPQCTEIFWRIDNITDGTTAEGSTSTRLPGASTALRIVHGVATQTTAAKHYRMQRIYVESDR